ncbi:MAG TPA: aromatic amino acid lyase [Alphaproteobacteria bacterium]|jgi:histidine ammonia-lyase|nr:aromatic amino acid lyase [Alphaproteobacteria bacterium]
MGEGTVLRHLKRSHGHIRTAAKTVLLTLILTGTAAATPYRGIVPQADATADPVTLTGHDLTVDQLVAVARHGQKVVVSPEAADHQDEAHGLLLEAAAEGVPIAGFNRAADGTAVLFDGDPTAPETAAMLRQKALAAFESGGSAAGAEIADEETVRAMMVVRANTLTYTPAGTGVTELLLRLLNDRITPAVSAANPLGGIAAAMVGKGDVYYHGIRMPAAQALSQAGLTPLAPVDDDYDALTGTEAYTTARTALLVADGRRMLEWSDLIFAMDLNGMNAGIAPLSLPAQENRPLKWTYWDAGRVLDMVKGGYLLTEDSPTPRPHPPGLDLSVTRQGAAWRAWGNLRDVVLVALNSSDQTPVLRPGLSQRESRELGSPRMLKYYVKGGRTNDGKRGFVIPALNRDPAPLEVEVEAFAAAVGMLNRAVAQRIAVPPPAAQPATDDGLVPVGRAHQLLETAFGLLAIDLGNAATLMEQRQAENPARAFGAAPTAAWIAFHMAAPGSDAARRFIDANQPSAFYPKGEPPLGSDDAIPLAQEKMDR